MCREHGSMPAVGSSSSKTFVQKEKCLQSHVQGAGLRKSCLSNRYGWALWSAAANQLFKAHGKYRSTSQLCISQRHQNAQLLPPPNGLTSSCTKAEPLETLTFGFPRTAMATDSRRFCPPLSFLAWLSRMGCISKSSNTFCTFTHRKQTYWLKNKKQAF